MRYIKHSESLRSADVPPGLMAAMEKFVTESMKSGIVLDIAGLKGTAHGSKVSLSLIGCDSWTPAVCGAKELGSPSNLFR
jgi:hypothetical protein